MTAEKVPWWHQHFLSGELIKDQFHSVYMFAVQREALFSWESIHSTMVSSNWYSFLLLTFLTMGVRNAKVVVCNSGLLQRKGCYCYPETSGLVGNGGNSRMFPYMPIAVLTRWFWNQNFLFPNVDYSPSFLNTRFLGALSNFRTIGPVRISSRTLSDPVLIPSLIWPQLKGLHSAFPTPRLKARENTQHKSLS